MLHLQVNQVFIFRSSSSLQFRFRHIFDIAQASFIILLYVCVCVCFSFRSFPVFTREIEREQRIDQTKSSSYMILFTGGYL